MRDRLAGGCIEAQGMLRLRSATGKARGTGHRTQGEERSAKLAKAPHLGGWGVEATED